MLLPFGGKVPRDEGAVFVAPNATVLGDVVLGPGSSVWYGATKSIFKNGHFTNAHLFELLKNV